MHSGRDKDHKTTLKLPAQAVCSPALSCCVCLRAAWEGSGKGSCPKLRAKGDKLLSLPFWYSADLSLPPEKVGRMMHSAYWTRHCMLQLYFVSQRVWLLTSQKEQLQGWIVSCKESIFIVPEHFCQIPQQKRQSQSKFPSQMRSSSVLVVHVLYSQLHG